MTVKNPKCLVVDASVARSAKGVDALHPIPIQCRDFLKEILALGHSIIMTFDVKSEWNKHQSPFSRTWYTNMLSRGLVRWVKENTTDDDLRRLVLEVIADNAKSTVEKDMHLIEAAQLADEIIASRDDKIRKHFQIASAKVKAIQAIVWVNPANSDEDCIIWLRQGAPGDDFRMLGYRDNH